MSGVFGKAASSLGASRPSDESQQADRPNILLIMADQLAAPFLAAYGHPVVKTPHIDRLAASGQVFESAYCNSPLCAPSRFSMMSGQLNSSIGAYDNASEFPSTIPTFAHYLRGAGYRTVLCGKMHFVGADQLHGYEERTTTDIYPADFGWTPDWDNFDERFDWWYHNMDSVIHAGVAQATNQLDFDDDVGFTAVRKLRDLARSSDERPWMLTASFTHPHDPYVCRQEHWDRYRHDEIDLPATPAGGIELDAHSQRLRHVVDYQASPITDEHIRNARHAYYGSISYIDDQVGELLATLESTGMADNTMIVFTADHGDMLGERGLWYKMSFFEHASRVPLIISQPGKFEPGVRISDHVSLVDLLPTFNQVAGVEPPQSLEGDLAGASLVPKLGGERDANATVVGEYLGEGAIAPIFMIRRGDMKYIWSSPDPAQLYDVANDPHEHHNVSGDPDWAHVEELFRAEIDHRWNSDELRAAVIENQNARTVVNTALRSGRFTPWDFQPMNDATNSYMRNHLDLNEVESGRRL